MKFYFFIVVDRSQADEARGTSSRDYIDLLSLLTRKKEFSKHGDKAHFKLYAVILYSPCVL